MYDDRTFGAFFYGIIGKEEDYTPDDVAIALGWIGEDPNGDPVPQNGYVYDYDTDAKDCLGPVGLGMMTHIWGGYPLACIYVANTLVCNDISCPRGFVMPTYTPEHVEALKVLAETLDLGPPQWYLISDLND